MPRKPRPPVDVQRRRLLAGLVTAPLAGGILSGVLPDALATPLPEETKEPAPAKKQEHGPHRVEAEALMVIMKERYGAYLEADQLAEVRGSIESQLDAGRQLSAAGLSNADEPDFVFTPYRGRDE